MNEAARWLEVIKAVRVRLNLTRPSALPSQVLNQGAVDLEAVPHNGRCWTFGDGSQLVIDDYGAVVRTASVVR